MKKLDLLKNLGKSVAVAGCFICAQSALAQNLTFHRLSMARICHVVSKVMARELHLRAAAQGAIVPSYLLANMALDKCPMSLIFLDGAFEADFTEERNREAILYALEELFRRVALPPNNEKEKLELAIEHSIGTVQRDNRNPLRGPQLHSNLIYLRFLADSADQLVRIERLNPKNLSKVDELRAAVLKIYLVDSPDVLASSAPLKAMLFRLRGITKL